MAKSSTSAKFENEAVEIELTKGFKTVIDKEDLEKVSKYKWHAHKRQRWGVASYCAASTPRKGSKRSPFLLHRFLMDFPKGLVVDHINGNQLDNRKSNLRICTNQQNSFNQRKLRKNKTSKFKGVWFDKATKKWRAGLTHNYKLISLGRFISELDAKAAYNKKAKEVFGDFYAA